MYDARLSICPLRNNLRNSLPQSSGRSKLLSGLHNMSSAKWHALVATKVHPSSLTRSTQEIPTTRRFDTHYSHGRSRCIYKDVCIVSNIYFPTWQYISQLVADTGENSPIQKAIVPDFKRSRRWYFHWTAPNVYGTGSGRCLTDRLCR